MISSSACLITKELRVVSLQLVAAASIGGCGYYYAQLSPASGGYSRATTIRGAARFRGNTVYSYSWL